MRIFLLIFLIVSINTILYSQQLLLPLNRDINLNYESITNQKEINFHTTLKPYVKNEIYQFYNPDSLIQAKRNKQFKTKPGRYLYKKLRKESFIMVDTSDFYLTIDPLFNLELGKNIVSDSAAYINTRGFRIEGNIGNNFSFSSSFYENQARYPNYVNEFISIYNVVPGQGPVKSFKTNDYDFSAASGNISFSPFRKMNIQLGNGKHFFGEGYRSLLLSDNAFNYPYLKLNYNFWKIQYTSMYTSFISKVNRTFTEEFPKKYASFHFLSYNIANRINISLFESTTWQASKNNTNSRYSAEYLNPVIFLPTAIYKLNDTNNVLIGLNLKYKIFNKFSLYLQIAIDNIKDFSQLTSNIENKFGYQLGLKGFDLFKIKNLNIVLEYNQVMPYTYSYYNSAQSYSHYNQSLAHPLGANFQETVGIVNYKIYDFLVEAKINYAQYGADTLNSNYGQNIFYTLNMANKNDINSNNNILQGLKTTLLIKDFRICYLINPATNMNIFIGISDRELKSSLSDQQSRYFFLGIRTSLVNYYYDF